MPTPTAPTCRVIRSPDVYTGKQAFTYRTGITAETTGSRGISMHLLNIPPGERARAHLHERPRERRLRHQRHVRNVVRRKSRGARVRQRR